MNKLNLIIKIILAGLFLGCLADMPYGYYQMVRFLGMAGFLILGFSEEEEYKEFWKYTWFASAILINPFIKIALDRQTLGIVDVVWAALLVVSIILKIKKR